MGIASAAWCVICGELPVVAVTAERHGTMMHYGSCRAHGYAVIDRALADISRIDHPSVQKVTGYIDVTHESTTHPLREIEP